MTPETQDVETEKTKRETWESMTPDQRFFVLETLEAALESVRNDRDVKDRAGAVIANELRKAEAELSSLRSQVETLRGYAQHKAECGAGSCQECGGWDRYCHEPHMATHEYVEASCDCGLSAALGKDSQ